MLDSTERVNALAQRLAACPEVTKLDRSNVEPESSELAFTLSELERSFVAILNDHLPKLIDSRIRDSELDGVLHDLGEELRHVLYHIGDSRYYSYLPPWGGAARDEAD